MAEPGVPYAYGFLSPQEVRFLDAAVERLIPTVRAIAGQRRAIRLINPLQ